MRVWGAIAVCFTIVTTDLAAGEFHQAPWVSSATCTSQDARRADSDLARLTSWAAVYNSFRRYKQCDDASIGEGYSDKIVVILTEHWPTVAALSKLTKTNPEFERFVLWHVDELMSPDQGKTIIDNAHNRCPAGVKEFCRRLEAKARNPF